MVVTVTSIPRVGLGLGMAALGRPGYINLDRSSTFGRGERSVAVMQENANTVMDTLFQQDGKPWLDCARSYGLSEKFVGDYLRSKKIDTDAVHVSSKWGYTYVADWKVALGEGEKHEVKDHSTENFLKQVEETKTHLGEFLDLYQIHSATFDSGILSDARAHAALAQCRSENGWALGLSVSGTNQDEIIREAMKIQVDGKPLFDSVQCTYNVLEQRPATALQEARDAGLYVIIKEALANGRALRNESVLKYAASLRCEPDQLALACVLAQPFEPRVLSGAVTSEQLESNWKAVPVYEKLKGDPELLDEIMKACRVDSKEYWDERSALKWN